MLQIFVCWLMITSPLCWLLWFFFNLTSLKRRENVRTSLFILYPTELSMFYWNSLLMYILNICYTVLLGLYLLYIFIHNYKQTYMYAYILLNAILNKVIAFWKFIHINNCVSGLTWTFLITSNRSNSLSYRVKMREFGW